MTTKKERREALERMTKAELVKTIVALDARQTKLLNEIAVLKTGTDKPAELPDTKGRVKIEGAAELMRVTRFPWEQI